MARFLPEDFFDNLPESPELAWAIAAEYGSNFIASEVNENSAVDNDKLVYREVYDFLDELGRTLGIRAELGDGSFSDKLKKVQSENIRLRSQDSIARIAQKYGPSGNQEPATTISPKTKMEIIGHVRELKSAVTDSDLDEKQKGRLLKRLDAFEQDLLVGRKSLRDAIIAISFIGAAIAGTTGTLAGAPEAWETLGRISGLIGLEAEQEEELKLLKKNDAPLPLAPPNDQEDAPK